MKPKDQPAIEKKIKHLIDHYEKMRSDNLSIQYNKGLRKAIVEELSKELALAEQRGYERGRLQQYNEFKNAFSQLQNATVIYENNGKSMTFNLVELFKQIEACALHHSEQGEGWLKCLCQCHAIENFGFEYKICNHCQKSEKGNQTLDKI